MFFVDLGGLPSIIPQALTALSKAKPAEMHMTHLKPERND